MCIVVVERRRRTGWMMNKLSDEREERSTQMACLLDLVVEQVSES